MPVITKLLINASQAKKTTYQKDSISEIKSSKIKFLQISSKIIVKWDLS